MELRARASTKQLNRPGVAVWGKGGAKRKVKAHFLRRRNPIRGLVVGIEEQEQRVLIGLAATRAETTGCCPPIEKNEREKHNCQYPLDGVPTIEAAFRARQKDQSIDNPNGQKQGNQVSDQVER